MIVRAGDVFGLLTVVDVLSPRAFRVRCECGRRRIIYVSQLARGYRSCGCLGRGNRTRYWPTALAWAEGGAAA